MVFKSGDECDRCHQVFEYQSTYLKHRKHYQCFKEDKLSTCTTCGNDFQNKYLLANHIRNIHKLKECLNCGKQIQATNFKRHMLTHEENVEEITFKCDTCDKQFIECHPNYNHTDKSTEEYGEDILTGIKHFNANNIGSIW